MFETPMLWWDEDPLHPISEDREETRINRAILSALNNAARFSSKPDIVIIDGVVYDNRSYR